jgi:hypothetical protein
MAIMEIKEIKEKSNDLKQLEEFVKDVPHRE